MPVPSVAGGHHAVEEIHAPGHGLQDIPRRAHAHQIAGLVLGHVLLHRLDGVVHLPVGLPYRKAPDGVAWQIQLRDALHVLDPDVMEHSTLVDAEEHLTGVYRILRGVILCQRLLAALQPAHRPGAGLDHIVPGRGDLDALIKGHGDVRAQVCLDAHALLRPHEDVSAVHMGVEADAVLLDLAQGGQGKDLKAAAVGEDGAVPGHELVQTAQLLDELVARTDMQVVGVG